VVRGQAVSARLPALVPFALALALSSIACDSLSEFGGTFNGPIVEGSFVRRCFGSDLRADLRFNPGSAVGSTRELMDEDRNWLKLLDEKDNVVFDAPLEPIYPITADTLADFDFPGQKRLRNYMLRARSSTGPLTDRDALVVVSLLATKRIELRVMARAADDDPDCTVEPETDRDDDIDAGVTPPREAEYYGLFKLKK
jgi:hypothetical protein